MFVYVLKKESNIIRNKEYEIKIVILANLDHF